jgi:hypothetical protein
LAHVAAGAEQTVVARRAVADGNWDTLPSVAHVRLAAGRGRASCAARASAAEAAERAIAAITAARAGVVATIAASTIAAPTIAAWRIDDGDATAAHHKPSRAQPS